MTVATSRLNPQEQRQGKTVPVDRLYLDEIPGAMDKMGWRVSAALMRRWFATKPAWVMGEGDRLRDAFADVHSSQLDENIVKMDWLLRFPTVRQACEQLRERWASPHGLRLLTRRLSNVGWAPGACASLGYGVSKGSHAESFNQVNYMAIGSYVDTFDDLFGALNMATLKVCVKGRTTLLPRSRREIFEVDKVGIYCRDTYDFGSDWLIDNTAGLGVWSRDRCLSKAEMAAYIGLPRPVRALTFPGFVPVRNADFRQWQRQKGTGGDYYVFSDICWFDANTDHVPLA